MGAAGDVAERGVCQGGAIGSGPRWSAHGEPARGHVRARLSHTRQRLGHAQSRHRIETRPGRITRRGGIDATYRRGRPGYWRNRCDEACYWLAATDEAAAPANGITECVQLAWKVTHATVDKKCFHFSKRSRTANPGQPRQAVVHSSFAHSRRMADGFAGTHHDQPAMVPRPPCVGRAEARQRRPPSGAGLERGSSTPETGRGGGRDLGCGNRAQWDGRSETTTAGRHGK